jgi:hypothetical protein
MNNMLNFSEKGYYIITIITWVSYILALTGIMSFNPEYLDTLNNITKVYVALFLVIRFNPFGNNKLTEFDKQIGWAAGIFLLLTTAITSTIKSYFIR